MKRWWKSVKASRFEYGWAIELDDKPVRTPARAMLALPTKALADAVAAEWANAAETIDPRAMPLTGLANAAIDRIAPDCAAFAAILARYAEADLACYRADGPKELVDRQAGVWDPLLAMARRRFDVDFAVTSGLLHVAQPSATVERLVAEVRQFDAFHLAGLAPLVTIGGSLVAALGVADGIIGVEDAWAAVSLDDNWQAEKWSADDEALANLELRHRDFLAGAHFLTLLAEE